MVAILDSYPPLGKKLGQYEIWREAVTAWTGPRSDRQSVIAACRERLRAHRRADVLASTSVVSITDEHLLAFLAGFATAEAHFGTTTEGHPHFRINLRSDDGELLRTFRDCLRIGSVVDIPPRATSQAAVSWRVMRLSELRDLTQALDRHPPRGRVLRIYDAWRDLVLLENRRSGMRRRLARRVKDLRAYRPGFEWRDAADAGAERRRRHVAVLTGWAAETEGPRTVTAYEGWRKASDRSLPTRNTIVSAFGTWADALGAAGIGTEGCRPADHVARMQSGTAATRATHRARQRRSILAAVRECAQMIGRYPSPAEYTAWRRSFAPATPSHTTVYRMFPDGWASVLQALGAEEGSAGCAQPLGPTPDCCRSGPGPAAPGVSVRAG
jgi:hypothetical protein